MKKFCDYCYEKERCPTLKQENEQLKQQIIEEEKQSLAKRICELQSDLAKAKSQIKKMICCENCKYYDEPFCRGRNEKDLSWCFNFDKWELAE